MTKIGGLSVLFGAAVLALACSQASVPGDGPQSTAPVPGNSAGVSESQRADWAAIVDLEGQAKRVANTVGCAESGGCRAAPVGSRACGGPRYYIPWCARTTDSAALYSKLGEVAKAEQAYNRKYGIASTCEYRMPPTVGVVAGACASR